MAKPAVIDNDFLQHLAETQGFEDTICQLIQKFFQWLDVAPELHELVYNNETRKDHPVICSLLSEKTVKIRQLDDIFTQGKAGKKYYEMLVRETYKEMCGDEYPCDDVCSQWQRGKSLGEVHCIVMCAFLHYTCFLSDDRGAKDLRGIIKRKMSRNIPIYSRNDCKSYLCKQEGQHILNSNELHRLCHS